MCYFREVTITGNRQADNHFKTESEMPKQSRGSTWTTLRRGLVILQRLQQGPASGEEIIAFVNARLGTEGYPADQLKASQQFKHDREKLKERVEVEISYNHRENLYSLLSQGPFLQWHLSSGSLSALQVIAHTFSSEPGARAEIDLLLKEITSNLPEKMKKVIETGRPPLEFNLAQSVEPTPINDRIWQTVQKAVETQRKLEFNYLSPSQEDRKPRRHIVAPYSIRVKDGHYYLYAYRLYWRNPYGREGYDWGTQDFRLAYILDDETLKVLPDRLPEGRRRPPRYFVHYLLLPKLARGAVSQRFQEMEITYLEDGSAEVRGYTENDFEAVRILLAYGKNCIVLGGDEIRRAVENQIRHMARNYGYIENWDET